MRSTIKALGATVALLLTGASLAACSSGSGNTGDGGTVTITVGDKPAADQPKSLEDFERRLAAFEKANPNIEIKAEETLWDAQTFQALVAGALG